MEKIGVVDDDQTMRDVMLAILEPQGYQVFTYPDGRTALERLPQDRPDLVILDVNLPDMTGPEICRALKQDERLKRLLVVMLTGEAREVEQRVEGLDAGADDYLFKPIGPKVLLSRVRALLQTPEARR